MRDPGTRIDGASLLAPRLLGSPRQCDRWRPWRALTPLLIAIACEPTLAQLVATTPLDAPGVPVW